MTAINAATIGSADMETEVFAAAGRKLAHRLGIRFGHLTFVQSLTGGPDEVQVYGPGKELLAKLAVDKPQPE